jgi:hypothetical protein
MKPAPRFAICIDNREVPASLELHKIYRVLPDSDALLFVCTRSPILLPSSLSLQ